MELSSLLIIALATWYAAYVVTKSDGPGHIFAWLRKALPLGGLTTCIVCASVWIAGALIIAWDSGQALRFFVYALAIAGAALMLGSYSGASHA